MAQQLINIGSANNSGNGEGLRSGGDKINDNFTELYNRMLNSTCSGYYTDDQYTVSSPLAVNSGAGRVQLTNNESDFIDGNSATEFPLGMWDNNKLIGVNNKDVFTTEIRFNAKSSAVNGYFTIDLDIGTVIRKESLAFYKSANTEQSFAIVLNYFSAATFISNGCEVFIESLNGNTSIYDIKILITRIHKGY